MMFHVKHEPWGPVDGPQLNGRQTAQLARYEELLAERAVPLGMIAESDLPRLAERHILDAIRGAPLLPPSVGSVCDLGSGAGLPGIPVAVARPDVRVTLVEARRNRAAFLELVVEQLELSNAEVRAGRVEDLPDASYDACLARAFAPLGATWQAARRLLRPPGVLLFWAGRGLDLGTEAPAGAHLTVSTTSSLADAGPIVIMTVQ
jgi:16S rRNA (guanine527-N7)-methyltransferase